MTNCEDTDPRAVAAHSTERGSAGSTPTITTIYPVDPALPRSVLCTLRGSVLCPLTALGPLISFLLLVFLQDLESAAAAICNVFEEVELLLFAVRPNNQPVEE